MIGQKVWSFAVGYLLIPFAFYVVNALGHLPVLEVGFPLLLNLVLVLTALASFLVVEAQRDRLRVRAPFASGLGAALGLLHWFPIYFMFGSRFLWQPVGATRGWSHMLLLNLVFPVISLMAATYDGSLLAVAASPVLLLLLAARWLRRTRASDA